MRLLLPDQPVTQGGDMPSLELVEIVQRLVLAVSALQDRLTALNAIADPAGGGTVDTEARAAIAAILNV